MVRSIDINSDAGERRHALEDGTEEELIASITSVNIACGGHAGDAWTMERSIELALRYRIGIGAHPGYPEPENFGRLSLRLSRGDITRLVLEQVSRLGAVARKLGAELSHVKPHGALYHDASRDPGVAEAIAEGVAGWSRELVLVGFAGSPMVDVWKRAGFRTAAEAFADRRYEDDGSLRSRKFPDALITDPALAAAQTLGIVRQGKIMTIGGAGLKVDASTICIHSDTPGSAGLARAVKRTLEAEGFIPSQSAIL